MAYTEARLVYEGSEEEFEVFTSFGALMAAMRKWQRRARANTGCTEIYLLHHDHPETEELCECIQFEQDLRPTWRWEAR